MVPGILESLCLLLLSVSSLVVVIALTGIVIAVIPLGWSALALYAGFGLVCAWIIYIKTVKFNAQPVSRWLILQSYFLAFVALVCWVLGLTRSFGFGVEASQVAGLALLFFFLLYLRRTFFPVEKKGTLETGSLARFFLLLGYGWMIIAVAFVVIATVAIFATDFFSGVSRAVSPMNFVNWLIILAWFLPAFIFRALGRAFRIVRPY